MLNEHLLSTEQILIIAMVSVKGENEEDQSVNMRERSYRKYNTRK